MTRRTIITSICSAAVLSAISYGNASAATPSAHASTIEAIHALDRALDRRDSFISSRQHVIDSLKESLSSERSFELLMSVADNYSSFSNDSAIIYYQSAEEAATNDDNRLCARLKRLSLMPLASIFEGAVKAFEETDTTGLPPQMMRAYYENGRRLYSYVASAYTDYAPYHELYIGKALDAQRHLIGLLPPDSDEHTFNLGEYYFLTGKHTRAKAMLSNLLTQTEDRSIIARAHHHLAGIAYNEKDHDAYRFHLACSALADIESATLEVISLQQLGSALNTDGDVDRAYRYLSVALDNAVRCGASLRMIESSKALPIIAEAHNNQIKAWRTMIYIIMGVMLVLLTGLGVTLVTLYRKMEFLKKLQESLRNANKSKDVYINQFLKLCSIYMDKLNQFCHIAERKISAGKTDEFYRMTKSGRFIEEQSAEFYEVFDNAFLHLYPEFVTEVNRLLKPECRITLKDGELLNTDLRILAISRMGIDDAASIAQILNYSLNTIYAYRNRLKARAINRETFEDDVMKIASAD